MTWLRLAYANLSLSPLTTLVNVILMALGTASIVLLLLASTQLQATMSRDAQGIDLVLGTSGSPVQLILSAVYHADVPPGNIKLVDTERWAEDPRVKRAVPMSLGDSYRGFRIVGTTTDYLEVYGGTVAEGRLWDAPMEAVLGAGVAASGALSLGADFAGAHGLVEGGHAHDSDQYSVVGVLAPTGTVLDRLVVTSLQSVWVLHDEGHAHDEEDGHDEEHGHDEEQGHDEEHGHDEDHTDTDEHAHHEADEDLEITAMLLTYSTPLAATTLPRQINAEGVLQAAAPAMEISRILQMIGIGISALGAFAWVLVATAALSIFAALYGSLRSRRGELAMLRCLGATRLELLFYLVVEGLLMTALGIAIGILAGHGVMELVGTWLSQTQGMDLTGWTWAGEEAALVLGLFLVGVVSAIIPAIQAYRTDVARTLAEG